MNRQNLIRTRWRTDGSIRFYREYYSQFNCQDLLL